MSESNSLYINPETGDYELNQGKPVRDTSLKTPAYVRLKAKRGQWLYSPNEKWGSDFHLIKKNRTNKIASREISTAEKALDPLLDDGRATSVEVEVTERARHGTMLQTKIKESLGEGEQTILTPIGE